MQFITHIHHCWFFASKAKSLVSSTWLKMWEKDRGGNIPLSERDQLQGTHLHSMKVKETIFPFQWQDGPGNPVLRKYVHDETHHYRLQEQEDILRQKGH